MKKFLGILILAFLFCGNSFAGEINLLKKKNKLPKDVCYVHYAGEKPQY